MGDVDTTAERRTGISGRLVVTCFLLASALWVTFLLVGAPRVRDGLGIPGVALPTPSGPVEVVLEETDDYVATGRWDELGACLRLDFANGDVTRTCAAAEALRPLWGVDVPDGPIPLVVVATAPDVERITARLAAGTNVVVPTLGGSADLPAAFAIIPLPEGATIHELIASAGGNDLVTADCRNGIDPALPNGGCAVPLDLRGAG